MASGFQATPPITSPSVMKDLITEIAPNPQRIQPSTIGKYPGPMRAAVPNF
jgi:hypothetical protein